MPQDIGCIQHGPLDIDIPQTWMAYRAFHEEWTRRVDQEARAMNAVKPDLVVTNISYLAMASAVQVGCPAIAIASLSWDRVLEGFFQQRSSFHQEILELIRGEYAKASQLIRLRPGIEMPAFSLVTDCGPSVMLPGAPTQHLRDLLGVSQDEKVVLLAFGGIPLRHLPWQQLEACEGFHFVVSGTNLKQPSVRVHTLDNLPLQFQDVFSQVDVVMTKPGYATIVTAVHCQIPVVFVRRNNFVDEQPLVDYVRQYGRAVELSREDFDAGHWAPTLKSVLMMPPPLKIAPESDCRRVAGVVKGFL